jgi:Mrp family chromosome partitioning ATPase
VAERVVRRLDLEKDSNFTVKSSLIEKVLASIRFWDSPLQSTSSSVTSVIATKLLKDLDVTNDIKSFLITISYTSASPEQSTRIANAFAEEYLRVRRETAARRQLGDLAVIYGPKHPNFLKAESKLNQALNATSVNESGQVLSWASTPPLPSGPNRRVIVALASLCSVAAGIVLVLLLERANTSFRTDAELFREIKVPCLGIFVEGAEAPNFEAARAIAAGAGLDAQSTQLKTLLVTSSVGDEGQCLVSTAIARALGSKRTLVVDLSPTAGTNFLASNARSLKTVLESIDQHPLKLDGELVILRLYENQSPINCSKLIQLLAQAREQFDFIIIVTPPVMMSADALYLSRHADFILHVVRWNSTPRRAVLAALDRLRAFGTSVHGVVLSRVHEKEYRRLTGLASHAWDARA